VRRDPTRIILPVLAAPLPDEDTIWLFMQGYKRIEAPGIQPFPVEEAVRRTLRALALTPAGEAPAPTAPQPTESADDLIARGKALMARKDYREASPLFERATQLAPRSFDAWAKLGLAYNEMGRHGDDLNAYDRALALDEKQAWVWGNKGKALRNLKRPEEALAVYERALALDPNYAVAWNNKGNALYDLGRYDESLAAYNQATTVDPRFAQAWSNKAFPLRKLGREAEAQAAEARAKALGG
jgi:tetratricopeptide (TPR) repeat protein